MSDSNKLAFTFGAFRLHPDEHALTREGQPIDVTPKEFDTLLALVEARGKVVGKEELISRVWPDSYVGDGSLARNISVLRKALGTEVIETVPRRGYRLKTPVVVAAPEVVSVAEEMLAPKAELLSTESSPTPRLAETDPAQLSADGPEVSGYVGRVVSSRWLGYAAIMIVTALIALATHNSVSHAKTESFHGRVRIAVLPFANYMGDPQQDYLCDGMTEAMTSELSRLSPSQMSVIARTSAMKFKSTDKAIPEIAQALQADYILESSVRGSNRRVRVTAQLVRGSDGLHVWTGEYERSLENVLEVQQQVAIAVSQEIRLSLDASVKRRLRTVRAVDPDAYQDYLLGRYYWGKRSQESLMKSVGFFERALARDPGYAPAYAGLADSYLVLGGGYLPDLEAYDKGRVAALKALELDSTLSDAYTSLAYEKFVNERDMAGADEDYQRALTIDANSSNAHHWYALYLSAMKRHDEAILHINRALELDPLAISVRYNAGLIYMAAGRTVEALALAQRALEMDPSSAPAHGALGLVYLASGQYEQAIAEMRAAQNLRSVFSPYAVEVARIYAMQGKREQARKQLASLTSPGWGQVAPFVFAVTYAVLGKKDKAFYWLRRCVDDHSCTANEINNERGLDSLRSDPRFSDLARPFLLASGKNPAS